ncbi:unnamed protein product [Pleuronectes platessa]|uniref:G-protein coupled receptors family 3 profile domain-containing protein n=1 Tax=Pleuronectes platessa TaxID=8262 RepID=A0A9N7VFM6_PLEPL|nr:unnamed protein product [Pleuronectes platessa]
MRNTVKKDGRHTWTGDKGKAADSGPNADEASSSDCLPCQPGCAFCKDDTPCVAREDGALRMAVVSFQCLCMLLVFISMVLVYYFRRNKSIRASGLVLLEAILCGALLLYFPLHAAFHSRGVGDKTGLAETNIPGLVGDPLLTVHSVGQ